MIFNIIKIIFHSRRYNVLSTACPLVRNEFIYLFQHQQNTSNIIKRFINESVEPIVVTKEIKKERVKTPEVVKITLLDSNDSILSVTTIPEAEKLATSKKLKLIKIVDTDLRTKRPIYKLISKVDYLQEELTEKRKLKLENAAKREKLTKKNKVILLSSKISENDFELKLKKCLKWLDKDFEIRTVISGSAENTSQQEILFKRFEKEIQGKGKISKNRIKNGDFKFHILPLEPQSQVKIPKQPVETNETTVESNNKFDISK